MTEGGARDGKNDICVGESRFETCPYGGGIECNVDGCTRGTHRWGPGRERMATRFLVEFRDDRLGGWGMGPRIREDNGRGRAVRVPAPTVGGGWVVGGRGQV